jgi:serine/threonine protein phosphatase PrpC
MALSMDHKPTNPGERMRIQKAGSFINAEGRVDGNLNLSRAIGDYFHK